VLEPSPSSLPAAPRPSSAKRVAYLVNQYPAVSHSFIRREILALERRGWDVIRVAIRGWDQTLVDPSDLAERERTHFLLRAGALPLGGALLRHALRRPAALLAAWRAAWGMARRSDRSWPTHLAYLAEAALLVDRMHEHDVTHVHAHFATNPAEVAMLASVLGSVSYSFTAHGSDIMDKPQQVALDHTVARASFVAAVCSFGRNQIFRWIPHGLWPRVQVVRCGLEPGYGAASPPIDVLSRPRLVCVGRLSKEKGQLLLLDAARLLRERGEPVPELVLAGDGPMRQELEALVQRYGLGGDVRFTGWLSAGQVEHEIQQARALVVPSLSEGLPVVIMEAMACGRPVVAPYLAGIPELVVEGRTGWLYPASSAEQLAEAMGRCAHASAAELAGMGQMARERVWSMHDIDRSAEALDALFVAAAKDRSRT
jgi:colanic acid/amylovoran biosynthesis glycosyltransferase